MVTSMLLLLVSITPSLMAQPTKQLTVIQARVFLFGAPGVTGQLFLTQQGDLPLLIQGRVVGLPPGSKHGFHVHQYGDVFTKGCDSTGTHFNPFAMTHGGPGDEKRHVGDLGNIVANEDGVADINFTDPLVQLSGPNSILGRSFVVHEKEDDLSTVANPGGRIACGVIALTPLIA